MDKARLSSESIVRVIAHYGDMLAGEDTAILNYLNSMAAPILHKLQRDLQSVQRQMATYTDVMNPNSVEYHTIQANAAEAITIAEINLSSNGLPLSSQVTTQSSPHLPATILTPATAVLNPVTTQHEQLGLDNTGEQTLSETAIANDKNMPADPLSNATTNNDKLGMQTDDEQILQINLRQDEVDQLVKLFEKTMEDPVIESPKTEDNPRDGLHSSISEPTLPKLVILR